MKKAVVIGGSGFIGRHLVRRLKQEGWKAIVVDKKEGMEMESPRILDLFRIERPEVVFHLAGPIQLRNPDFNTAFEICASLLKGTKNVLEASHMVGVQRFIFSSSGGAVYEDTTQIPTSETHPAKSSSLYGLTTLLLEKLIQGYEDAHNVPTAILRMSNVYGPEQWDNVVRRFVEAMRKNEPPTIRGDGSSTRDYIYIDDVIEAFWKTTNVEATGIFNIGSSKETSLKDVFETIADALQWKGEPRYNKVAHQAVSRNALDCTKAERELEWQPIVPFSDGIRRTVAAMN